MIPPVLHQIWLQGGDPPPPLRLLLWMEEAIFAAAGAGWRYRIWSARDVALLSQAGQALWARYAPLCAHLPAQQSDLLRTLILYEHGGLYLDADVEVFRLPVPTSGAWIAGVDGPGQVTPSTVAADPGHPYLVRIIDQFESIDWTRHGSCPNLYRVSLGDDVNVWPRKCWRGDASDPAVYGHHHCMGASLGTFRGARPW